jgi:DNA-binding CsgD family transcriptional regulator
MAGAALYDFSAEAGRVFRRAFPFDGICVVTMDPATLVPTDEVCENGLPDAVLPRMAEIELSGADVSAFAALAQSGELAVSLSEATGGDLDRSLRHRELKAPHGFGDELRAVLVSAGAVWGGVTLLRTADRAHFTAADSARAAALATELADTLRRALLGPVSGNGHDPAGVVVLGRDNAIVSANAAAERWLDELGDSPAVTAVASRARSDETAATARVRTAAGRWVLVSGSRLGDDVAVIVEPVSPRALAPLIAEAYGMTERERDVAELVAQGFGTTEIGRRLCISPWTVQDHLKTIFEKVGVSTRGELTARLFFEHDAPSLSRSPKGLPDR